MISIFGIRAFYRNQSLRQRAITKNTTTMTDVKSEIEKKTGPSSIKFPMLSSSNYTVWAMRMKIALKVNKVWEKIDPRSKHEEKNDLAIALIF